MPGYRPRVTPRKLNGTEDDRDLTYLMAEYNRKRSGAQEAPRLTAMLQGSKDR